MNRLIFATFLIGTFVLIGCKDETVVNFVQSRHKGLLDYHEQVQGLMK